MRDLSICPLHASLNSFLSSHRNSISVRPFDHFIQKCIILLIGIILGPPLYETCHRRYVYVIVGSSSFSFLFLFQIWDLYENGNNCCTRRSTLSSFSVGYFFFCIPLTQQAMAMATPCRRWITHSGGDDGSTKSRRSRFSSSILCLGMMSAAFMSRPKTRSCWCIVAVSLYNCCVICVCNVWIKNQRQQ